MTALDLANPGLRDIFRMGVRRVYAYRMFTYLGVLQVFLQLLLLRAVWQAVYGDRDSVEGVPIETMVTYLTVVGLINFIIYPGIASEIGRRIVEYLDILGSRVRLLDLLKTERLLRLQDQITTQMRDFGRSVVGRTLSVLIEKKGRQAGQVGGKVAGGHRPVLDGRVHTRG